MSDEHAELACAGHSALHRCGAPVRYAVSRSAGKGKVATSHACGRHLSWLVDYVTVPGRTVEVTRL